MNKRENFSILYKKYLFIYSKIINVFNFGKLLSSINVIGKYATIRNLTFLRNIILNKIHKSVFVNHFFLHFATKRLGFDIKQKSWYISQSI